MECEVLLVCTCKISLVINTVRIDLGIAVRSFKGVVGRHLIVSGRNYYDAFSGGVGENVFTEVERGAADRILNGRLGSHAKEEIFIGVGKNILVSANFGSCIHVGYIVSVYILIA